MASSRAPSRARISAPYFAALGRVRQGECHVCRIGQSRWEPRVHRQHLLIIGKGLLGVFHFPEGVTAVAQRLDQTGIDRKRLGIAPQRLVESPEMRQRDAAVAERLGVARLQRQRAIKIGQRAVQLLEGLKQGAAIAQQRRRIRPQRQSLVQGRKRLLRPPQRVERIGAPTSASSRSGLRLRASR